MRNNIYKLYMLLFLLSSITAGCEKYLDINDDPNNPTQAPLTGLLSDATFQTAENTQDLGSITSYYVQYLASPNPASSTDIHDEVSYGDEWAGLYNVMTDLSDLEKQAQATGATEYQGVAKILKAIQLGMTVDAWGAIPYTEAFFAETLTPSYNDDRALYEEIFTLLNDGIALLETGASTVKIGNDDFIYEGDINKWIQTGYMLKARYLNHLSKTATYAPVEVLAALDKGYTSNEDDAQVNYFTEQVNPWASVAISNAGLILGGWLSEQFIQAMNGTTYGVFDPRLPFMADTTEEGTYVGTENGAGRGTAPPSGARSTLTTDTWYAAQTAPVLIATYAEQRFIEAEAAFRANQRERAYQAYREGIRAHMNKLGVDTTQRNIYLAQPIVSMGAANLTIDDIFREKYKVMFLHPEAWVDARRYNYQYKDMTLPANHNPALTGNFIRRLPYPDSELTRNRSNVPAVQLSTPLWWDQP